MSSVGQSLFSDSKTPSCDAIIGTVEAAAFGRSKAQLLIVPGSEHGTFTDRSALVNLAIREFIDKP